MIGDTVDNIIGVRGVGPKTAEKLLNQYGNLKNILEHKDQLKPKLKEAFEEAEERLKENIFLVSLEKNIDIDIQPEDLKKEKADLLKLRDIFKELGFKSLLKDIEKKKVIEKKVEQRTLF